MKSITMNMRWVYWMLLLMGLLFAGIGVVAFLFAAGFETLTEERVFKYVFLGIFGGSGLILFVVGLCIAFRMRRKKALAERLMSMGTCAWAEVVDITGNQNVRVNNRSPYVLRCTYHHTDGQTYMFKSGYLRYNPGQMLKDGKVKVWFDPYDIKQYVVDVEGSLKEPIIEV